MTSKQIRVAVAAIAVCVVAAGAYLISTHVGARAATPAARARARDLDGARVRVQVLNATSTPGLALRATRVLRDAGFDVLEMGTAGTHRDTTLVVDRSGHPDWARTAAAALGDPPVATELDSSRYLDITVFIGASWRPPPDPLGP